MSKQTVALLTFGTALVASVATSPARWQVYDEADGASFSVDATTPVTSLFLEVDAEDVESAYSSELFVRLVVTEAVDAEGGPLTLDFVLVEETERGTENVAAITNWTLQPATEENPFPEEVYLTSWDAQRDGTWRVDVTMTAGASAQIDWNASVLIEGDGNEQPEGAAVELVIDPAGR